MKAKQKQNYPMTTTTYRYVCSTENAYVYETVARGAPVPTVCVNDAASISDLVEVDGPQFIHGATFQNGNDTDFTGHDIIGLSHTSLDDVGTNTHADIDAHIADASLHRTINDAGTGTTDLWSADKIGTELAGKSNVGHTHTASEITDFASAADARIAAQKGAANGVATLDASSKIPSAQLPALAITTVSVVADIAERDALTVQSGDVAKVLDADGAGNYDTYIYDGSTWIELQITEPQAVTSVNSKLGDVVLDTDDVSEGATNLYYTDARVGAQSDVVLNTTHRGRTDNPHNVTAAQIGLGDVANLKSNLSATTDPTVDDDTADGYSVGSTWINTTDDTVWTAVDVSAGAAVWRSLSGGELPLVLNFKTNKASPYRLAGTFEYPGSRARGIRSISVVSKASTAVAYKVRITDLENQSAEIAKNEALSGTTAHRASLTLTPANVPTSNHMFEVWLASGANGQVATLYSLLIEYK